MTYNMIDVCSPMTPLHVLKNRPMRQNWKSTGKPPVQRWTTSNLPKKGNFVYRLPYQGSLWFSKQ